MNIELKLAKQILGEPVRKGPTTISTGSLLQGLFRLNGREAGSSGGVKQFWNVINILAKPVVYMTQRLCKQTILSLRSNSQTLSGTLVMGGLSALIATREKVCERKKRVVGQRSPVSLPLWPEMSDEEVERVIEAVLATNQLI